LKIPKGTPASVIIKLPEIVCSSQINGNMISNKKYYYHANHLEGSTYKIEVEKKAQEINPKPSKSSGPFNHPFPWCSPADSTPTSNCLNGLHKFEPRYNTYEGQPTEGIKEAGRWHNAENARYFLDGLAVTKRTDYVYDICIKCGKRIKRHNK